VALHPNPPRARLGQGLPLGDLGAEAAAGFLKRLGGDEGLEWLDLSETGVGDYGAARLLAALPDLPPWFRDLGLRVMTTSVMTAHRRLHHISGDHISDDCTQPLAPHQWRPHQ
jgi:hypothetical protein